MNKAQKRKIRNFSLKLFKYCIFVILVGCSAIFLLYNHKMDGQKLEWKIKSLIQEKIEQVTIMSGFVLNNLYLQGCDSFDIDEDSAEKILEVSGVDTGQSIFKYSPQTIRQNISKLSWVRNVIVDRSLPNSLYITIEERRPIAIKQYKRRLTLIDEDGAEYTPEDIYPYLNHPIIVSQDAEVYAKNLIKILSINTKIFSTINSVVQVGNRRWDVVLKNGTIIKLPEQDMERRWQMLAEMASAKELVLEEYKTIDLRVPKRMFLEKNNLEKKNIKE